MWGTYENSLSVLCCCHIIQLVVEERNFLSHHIIYFSQFMLVVQDSADECAHGDSKYVAQNKCVLFQEKCLSVDKKC